MGDSWLEIRVPGHGAGLTAVRSVADPWKTAVWQEAQRQWLQGVVQEPCAVHLTFHVTPARFRDTALFNLLKSTIDGLGRAIFAQSAAGQPAPWGTDDWWITQLIAQKKVVDRDPFVDIEVHAATPGSITWAAPPSWRLYVPGEPPLWPGDNAGQVRVLEWRAKLGRLAGARPAQMPRDAQCVALDFNISPSRMQLADLDNFCVPAAQAVCAAVYGDLNHGPAITEIYATKTPAPAGKEGTAIGIW